MLSKLFLVVVTAAILAAAGLVPREDTTDFSKRCPKGIRGDRRISSDNKVFARCRKEGNGGTQFQDNDFVWSVLNLGQCFANDNGVVVPRLSGNMQKTCMPCELELETTNMICSCPNTQDEWIKSETELSKSAPS